MPFGAALAIGCEDLGSVDASNDDGDEVGDVGGLGGGGSFEASMEFPRGAFGAHVAIVDFRPSACVCGVVL